MVETHGINWASAEVEPVGHFYELRVDVSFAEGVSLNWEDAFNHGATLLYKQTRGEPWGAVTMSRNTILVQELEPGAENALKRYLNQLVKTTDLSADERRNGKLGQEHADDADDRRRTAKRMIDRFRAELADLISPD